LFVFQHHCHHSRIHKTHCHTAMAVTTTARRRRPPHALLPAAVQPPSATVPLLPLLFFFFFFCFCGNAAPPFLFGNTPPHDGAPSFVTFWRRFLPLCGHVTEIVRHGGAIAIARHLVCVGVVEHRHKWQKHSYYVSEKNKIHITCKTREQ
jgi:hypothetical protein